MSTVTFNYAAEDLGDAWKAQWRGVPFLKVLRIAPYFIIALNLAPSLYLGLTEGRWSVGLAAGFSAGMGLFLIGLNVYHYRVLVPKRAARVLAQQVTLQGLMSANWTPSGIEFRHATGDQRLAWTDFVKWIEGPSSLVLLQSDTVMNLIPKRCLTEAQIDEIKGFLAPVKKGG